MTEKEKTRNGAWHAWDYRKWKVVPRSLWGAAGRASVKDEPGHVHLIAVAAFAVKETAGPPSTGVMYEARSYRAFPRFEIPKG